jgi:hypothetical protein
MFLECLESLLGRDADSGFRGVQSKSLIDIVQLECLSQSSTVLRITHGALTGKIWIQGGELIDAETEGASGEVAFRRILEWRSGTFENLPPEPERQRAINKPVSALLLETAQAMDEIANPAQAGSDEEAGHRKTVWRLATLTREGAEWVVSLSYSGNAEGWGTQAAEEVAKWMAHAKETCKRLSERLETGPLSHIEGRSLDRCLVFLPWDNKTFVVSWPPDADAGRLLEQTQRLVASWDS